MIKICRYIEIHFLTIMLFFVCFFFGRGQTFLITYLVMIFHELSHMFAALFIGLKIDKITFYAFGVNLKLKNKFVHSFTDELILYLAGPLFNAFFALIMLFLYGYFRIESLRYLYFMNLVLFSVNMLPVMPLDGGVLLKKIITYFSCDKKAKNIMRFLSVSICLVLLAICIYGVLVSKFNFSLVIMVIFLFGSILTGGEKYNVDFVKELMFADSENKKRKINHIIAQIDEKPQKIIEKFSNNKYNIVYLVDNCGKICNTYTQKQILDKLLK